MPALRCKRALILVLPVLAILSGCGTATSGGGSSSDAKTILRQTFGATHHLTSGRLQVSVNIDPGGSSTLVTPISVSLGGPFQTHGTGLPSSDFTASISALGRQGSIGLVSTGSAGFVRLSSAAYQLPQATFQKLESSFAGLAGGSGGNGGGLSKLGIDPMRWVSHPTVVGEEKVGGVPTTHVHGSVDVATLLGDLNTFIAKAGAGGLTGAGPLSTSMRQKIAAAVRAPGFDVWSGKSDHAPRKIEVSLTIPVSGSISSTLGGLKSLGVDVSVTYTQLGVAQTITAPPATRPYAEFQAKEKAFLGQIRSVLPGLAGAGAAPGGSTTGQTGTSDAYRKCIVAAGNDVTKMQSCSSLLSPSGG